MGDGRLNEYDPAPAATVFHSGQVNILRILKTKLALNGSL